VSAAHSKASRVAEWEKDPNRCWHCGALLSSDDEEAENNMCDLHLEEFIAACEEYRSVTLEHVAPGGER